VHAETWLTTAMLKAHLKNFEKRKQNGVTFGWGGWHFHQHFFGRWFR